MEENCYLTDQPPVRYYIRTSYTQKFPCRCAGTGGYDALSMAAAGTGRIPGRRRRRSRSVSLRRGGRFFCGRMSTMITGITTAHRKPSAIPSAGLGPDCSGYLGWSGL